MKNVQQEIARAISAKIVVQTTKTKAIAQGGRQLVSVGRYVTAIPVISQKYALITKNEVIFSSSAITAARNFIDFVGRQHAWDALVAAYRKKGYREDANRLADVR